MHSIRFIAALLLAIQAFLPVGVGFVYAQEGTGLFGFLVQESFLDEYSVFSTYRTPLSENAILASEDSEQIKRYLGTQAIEDRSQSIVQASLCCSSVRSALTPSDFAELLNGVTYEAVEKLLPEEDIEEYITSMEHGQYNVFFSTLNASNIGRIARTLSQDTLREVLLSLSDTNQEKVLKSMSQDELDTFVEKENESGMGGALLVGLGAAAALYLLSTASAPVAAAATAGLQVANGVNLVPYGGRSLGVVPCTCTPGFFLVLVGPPRPGLFMYGPGTFLFSFYNIFPPAWQLGKASVPLTCLVYTGGACVPVGIGLYVIMAGTSVL